MIPISQAIMWEIFPLQQRGMLFHDTVAQAQVLAYADELWMLSLFFFAIVVVLPFMRRIRTEAGMPSAEARVEGLPAAE
jgi:hypothetical protein